MPRSTHAFAKRPLPIQLQAAATGTKSDNGSAGRASPLDHGMLFLRLPTVMRLTGLARSTIYRLMASQSFPLPVKLAARAVAWRREDIEAWSQARTTSMH